MFHQTSNGYCITMDGWFAGRQSPVHVLLNCLKFLKMLASVINHRKLLFSTTFRFIFFSSPSFHAVGFYFHCVHFNPDGLN